MSTICRTGLIVPNAFETWDTATMRVAAVEQLFVFFEDQVAAIVDRDEAQQRIRLFAQHLPRHDVGVVFECR